MPDSHPSIKQPRLAGLVWGSESDHCPHPDACQVGVAQLLRSQREEVAREAAMTSKHVLQALRLETVTIATWFLLRTVL